MHKTKSRTATPSFLKNLSSLLIRFDMPFKGNCRKSQINFELIKINFEFPLKVQQYGRALTEVRKKYFNRLIFLKPRRKTNCLKTN